MHTAKSEERQESHAAAAPIPGHAVLVVDDEELIREELTGYLSDKGFNCLEAGNGCEAMEVLYANPQIGVVVSDIRMPGQDGLELLAEAMGDRSLDVAFLMLTGHGGKKEAIRALRLGAEDFLEKPVDLRHLLHAIERAVEYLDLRRSKKLFQESLEAEVSAKTAEIRSLMSSLALSQEEALRFLAVAAEYKDTDTGYHIKRIGLYSELFGRILGWPADRCRTIRLAAPLHDVGKIGIPDAILRKPGKLDPEEWEIMATHPEIGKRILSGSNDPTIKCAAKIAYGHHETWDGSGYPQKLRGKEIPIEARIVSLVDVYDALRSVRPYKKGMTHEDALDLILNGTGRTEPNHFDPELRELLNEYNAEFADIFSTYGD